jgi:hypothetical protein
MFLDKPSVEFNIPSNPLLRAMFLLEPSAARNVPHKPSAEFNIPSNPQLRTKFLLEPSAARNVSS